MSGLASYVGTASAQHLPYQQEETDFGATTIEHSSGKRVTYIVFTDQPSHNLSHASSPQESIIDSEVSKIVKDVEEYLDRNRKAKVIQGLRAPYLTGQGNYPPVLNRILDELDRLPERIRHSDLFINEIDNESLVIARRLIIALYEKIISSGQSWYAPHLTTEDTGDVEFEWWHSNHALLISVAGSEVHSLKVRGPNPEKDMDYDPSPSISDLASYYQWLFD